MPTGNTYGNLSLPSGFAHIQRFGPSESALAQFLYPFAFRNVVFAFDDFLGPALNTHLWTAANSANGTAFDPPATQLASGVARGVSGAFASDTITLRSDAIWLGDQNCGMELKWKIDNITSLQMEIGFNDPLTTETSTAINDIDTPTITNGAVDVALVGMDTGQTLTTLAFITDGSTANMNTTKTNLGTRSPTNAQYQHVRVQLSGDTAKCLVLDNNQALQESAQHGDVLASRIEGGTLVAARICYESLTTSARTVDVDWWAIWQDR